MKTRNQLFGLIAIAIIAMAFIACGGNDSDPTPETFTVTFHANGGTPEPQPQTIEKGKTATQPQGVANYGYPLVGWFKETAFTTQWNFATDTVTANIDLYAKWEQEKQHDSFHDVEVWSDYPVTDDEVATVIGYLTEIYSYFSNNEKNRFATLTEIRIQTGTGISKNNNVLTIGADETLDNLIDYIFDVVVAQ